LFGKIKIIIDRQWLPIFISGYYTTII